MSQITLTLPAELHDAVYDHAELSGLKYSEIVQRAIRERLITELGDDYGFITARLDSYGDRTAEDE